MFYPVFAVFMVLVCVFIAATVVEYGMALPVRGGGGLVLFGGALLLLVLALWWAYDATRMASPSTGIELIRAVVFAFLAGPILGAPALVVQTAGGGGATFGFGRVRRLIWRPASFVGLALIVLWFLS